MKNFTVACSMCVSIIGVKKALLWLTLRTSKRAGGSGWVCCWRLPAPLVLALRGREAGMGEATTAEIIEDDVAGRSFATLLAFLARFLRAAANEEELLSVGPFWGGEPEFGRLMDESGEEAKDATLLVTLFPEKISKNEISARKTQILTSFYCEKLFFTLIIF